MIKRNPKKQPIRNLSELDMKVQNADPMIKEAFSQYHKEIARLQKQLVKEQISHESEKLYLQELSRQNKINIVIDKEDSNA